MGVSWLLSPLGYLQGEGSLSQEAGCLALPTAATLCRLAELFEAEGFGEVGQVHSAVPEAGRNGVLGIGVCRLLQCRLLLVDWIGIHRASGGLPSPVVPALQPAGTKDHG